MIYFVTRNIYLLFKHCCYSSGAMDSLTLIFLHEGKKKIQTQHLLYIEHSPTSIPTDRRPSASHREFEKNYNKMPQSPTSIPTDRRPSASHREFENNYNKMPQSPTDRQPSASHREFENNYNKMPQSLTSIPTELSTLIPTE